MAYLFDGLPFAEYRARRLALRPPLPYIDPNSIPLPPIRLSPELRDYDLEEEEFEILPCFEGLPGEDARGFIERYEATFQRLPLKGFTIDEVKMRIFPYQLKDRARTWLKNQKPDSLTTWNEVYARFMRDFYDPYADSCPQQDASSIHFPDSSFNESYAPTNPYPPSYDNSYIPPHDSNYPNHSYSSASYATPTPPNQTPKFDPYYQNLPYIPNPYYQSHIPNHYPPTSNTYNTSYEHYPPSHSTLYSSSPSYNSYAPPINNSYSSSYESSTPPSPHSYVPSYESYSPLPEHLPPSFPHSYTPPVHIHETCNEENQLGYDDVPSFVVVEPDTVVGELRVSTILEEVCKEMVVVEEVNLEFEPTPLSLLEDHLELSVGCLPLEIPEALDDWLSLNSLCEDVGEMGPAMKDVEELIPFVVEIGVDEELLVKDIDPPLVFSDISIHDVEKEVLMVDKPEECVVPCISEIVLVDDYSRFRPPKPLESLFPSHASPFLDITKHEHDVLSSIPALEWPNEEFSCSTDTLVLPLPEHHNLAVRCGDLHMVIDYSRFRPPKQVELSIPFIMLLASHAHLGGYYHPFLLLENTKVWHDRHLFLDPG